VRDSFERARALFAEAADTTAAAFTDEIQRTGRKSWRDSTKRCGAPRMERGAQLDAVRMELTQKTTAEQEGFLRRFQSSMRGALEAGVAEAQQKVSEGFGPLLDSWKSDDGCSSAGNAEHLCPDGEQAAEQY